MFSPNYNCDPIL